MNEQELQELVEKTSLKYFNKAFKHQAFFNSRLKTTGGRYHLKNHHLDFNPKIYQLFGKEIFIGIIKHELCHYHLHIENKGYRHRDKDFKNLLQEVKGLRYTPSIEEKKGYGVRWKYECNQCETPLFRKYRFNIKKYVCSNCLNHFELIGKEKISI